MLLIQFEDVPTNRFYVTEDGRVWDSKRERWLVQTRSPLANGKPGYVSVGFMQGSKVKRKYVHRLVAHAYCANPKSAPEVNHKDGDKTNNHASNLEWVTKSENHLHAYKLGLKHNPLTYGLLALPHWLR